jgi:hypothetical protein
MLYITVSGENFANSRCIEAKNQARPAPYTTISTL